ncbi:MAG: hypothetical protein E2O53_12180 [Gammaproteobacteria bacterium]|nr:MAG: hypothetical protein E2O53_12180 [Gammaproteobacteria bacterium]
MSKVIPLEDQKHSRDHRDIHEDVDEKLSEIYAIAALLAAADSDRIFIGQINATGYLLTRMIDDAKEIAREHYSLWREEIAEGQKD